MIVPSLPLVGVLLIVLFFIGVQGVFWPMLVTNKPVNQPMSTVLVLLKGQFADSGELLAAAVTLFTVPIVMFFFPVFVGFQLFYLDRLALRAGAEKIDER
jgi:ABC-type glycerol-3-phosphate transport system permease component